MEAQVLCLLMQTWLITRWAGYPSVTSRLRIQGVFRRHVHLAIVDVSKHRFKCLLAGNHFAYRNIHLSIFWHEGAEHGFKVTGKRKQAAVRHSAGRCLTQSCSEAALQQSSIFRWQPWQKHPWTVVLCMSACERTPNIIPIISISTTCNFSLFLEN